MRIRSYNNAVPRQDSDHGALSREEIAVRLNLTKSRVGQIEREALRKMKLAAEEKGYSIFDLIEIIGHD